MYNFKITLWKGIKSGLQFAIPIVLAYLYSTDVANMTIIDIITGFFPWLGGLTVGGAIVALNNWLKNSK